MQEHIESRVAEVHVEELAAAEGIRVPARRELLSDICGEDGHAEHGGLGQADDVRPQCARFTEKGCARARERLHFVRNEERTGTVAAGAQAAERLAVRGAVAAFALKGLEDDRRQRALLVEKVGEGTRLDEAVHRGRVVWVDVPRPAPQRKPLSLSQPAPGERETSERAPVKGALQGNHEEGVVAPDGACVVREEGVLVDAELPADGGPRLRPVRDQEALVGTQRGRLDGGFHRLCSAVREKDAIAPLAWEGALRLARHELGELLGEAHARRGVADEVVRVDLAPEEQSGVEQRLHPGPQPGVVEEALGDALVEIEVDAAPQADIDPGRRTVELDDRRVLRQRGCHERRAVTVAHVREPLGIGGRRRRLRGAAVQGDAATLHVWEGVTLALAQEVVAFGVHRRSVEQVGVHQGPPLPPPRTPSIEPSAPPSGRSPTEGLQRG